MCICDDFSIVHVIKYAMYKETNLFFAKWGNILSKEKSVSADMLSEIV